MFEITASLSGDFANGRETTASINGRILTVDGADYDLSGLGEGDIATAEGQHPFIGPIAMADGVTRLALLWSYDPATADPDQGTGHPVLTVTSGAVPDPVKRLPVEAPADDV